MQSFLSFFFEAVFLTGSAYVSVGFVLGLMRLWHESHPDVVAIQERQKRQMALPAATAPVMSEAMAMQDLRQLETVMLDDEMS
ncbi:MAG: hypothetical protein AAF327_18320 [Cyanobacteria bacterium P01_A01_bin.37]